MPFNFNRPKFKSSTSQPVFSRDMLRASASLDFPSIATTAQALLTISVPGAAVGDDVTVHLDAPVAGIRYDGYVSATDTVTVRATNVTAGSIDPAATTVRCIVWKQY